MQRLLFPHFIFQANIFYALIFLFSLIGCAKYSEQVQANLTKLKNTKSCPGCDLSGIELISFDLKNADLIGFVEFFGFMRSSLKTQTQLVPDLLKMWKKCEKNTKK